MQKPLGAEGGGEVGAEHLHGDRTVVLAVVREVDHRYSAVADLTVGFNPDGWGKLPDPSEVFRTDFEAAVTESRSR